MQLVVMEWNPYFLHNLMFWTEKCIWVVRLDFFFHFGQKFQAIFDEISNWGMPKALQNSMALPPKKIGWPKFSYRLLHYSTQLIIQKVASHLTKAKKMSVVLLGSFPEIVSRYMESDTKKKIYSLLDKAQWRTGKDLVI